jgi:membrane fusion protein (multidrug efflux system)
MLLITVLPLLAAAAPPPPAVIVQPVVIGNVAPVETFPGQVQAIQSVSIVARVQAYIDSVAFTEGSMVKAGQLLFRLQQAPYQAALLQARGSVAQTQAALQNAQLNLERDQKVGVGLAISQQQIQQDQAARDEAAGQVDTAQGALDTAAINLSYCTITAPISGRIGKALITRGNLVGPTSGSLATIVQMDPIRVSFAVTDSELVSIEQKAGKTRDELIGTASLTLVLPNGSTYAEKGSVEFLANQVDTATGTITVYGRFANPQGYLIPGSYVDVDVQPVKPENRPLVAVQSVQNDAQGQFVLLVDHDRKVEQRRVTVGRQIGQDYIVDSGLTGGELVITEGLQKVHPGEKVAASTAPPSPTTSTSGTAPSGTSPAGTAPSGTAQTGGPDDDGG